MLHWESGSERLQSKTSLLKTRKAFKNQEEIFTCALENGHSKKIGEASGKCPCESCFDSVTLWLY